MAKANDRQEGGSHYKDKAIQPWDFISSNDMGFLAGNVVKYVARYKEKNGMQDLLKAKHYLEKLMEVEGTLAPKYTVTADGENKVGGYTITPGESEYVSMFTVDRLKSEEVMKKHSGPIDTQRYGTSEPISSLNSELKVGDSFTYNGVPYMVVEGKAQQVVDPLGPPDWNSVGQTEHRKSGEKPLETPEERMARYSFGY